MKTWKKITIAIVIILIVGLVFLYFYGWRTSTGPGGAGPDGVENPIFPFETPGSGFFTGDDDTDTGEEDEDPASDTPPDLWQISQEPVAGSQWVKRGNAAEEIWHVRKENGHLYSSSPDERDPVRIANNTIPRVRQAYISPRGDYIVYQYLQDNSQQIRTYLGRVVEADSGEVRYTVNGEFLPNNITTVSLSPDGSEIFYLRESSSGVIGSVYNVDDDETRIVFESSIKEWRSQWTTANQVVLFNKPAVNTEGFAHAVNTRTGEMTKLAEGDGLIAGLSPNSAYVLKSSQENNEYRANISTLAKRQTTIMSPRTTADKCGWAQSTNVLFCGIPDDLSSSPLKEWYQGKYNFNDTLALFNPDNRDRSVLFSDSQREKGPFDITEIKVDTTFHFLLFTNKRDGILWGFVL